MKKKRNKKYVPKPVMLDSMNWAMSGAHKLPKYKRDELLIPVDTAYKAMQRGEATREEWNTVANALNIAEALSEMQIGANLIPLIQAGLSALHDVAMRMLGGAKSTCKGAELTAIYEALDMYRIQLTECSQGEMSRAVKKVNDLHRSGAMDDVLQIYKQMDREAA